jgi:predicted AAA+ superfamily ATPase
MWLERYYENKLDSLIKPGKVLVIYGMRRTGKTSLIKKYLSTYKGKYFSGTGEDLFLREILESQSVQKISSAFNSYDLIVIDEAQFISNIGLGLKILVDSNSKIKIIATGSSSFDLSNKLGEPLTGRQRIIKLYPISISELTNQIGPMEIQAKLNDYLIYGSFPETLQLKNKNDKIEYLHTLRDSYLLKDLLILENLRNSNKLIDLLRLIAFQIGKEVSLNELSNSLDLSKQTVFRYLDLLEKVFIIKKISGFSRNLRKEISKTNRYYFCDNGLRNAIINNFDFIENRHDIGMLWENFILMERLKRNSYKRHYANYYFWRTYDRQEIDFIEEYDGELHGYEFKWKNKIAKAPAIWMNTYEKTFFDNINKDNFLEFVS